MKTTMLFVLVAAGAAISQGASAAVARPLADPVTLDAGHALRLTREAACTEARQSVEAMFQAPLEEPGRQFGVDGTQIFVGEAGSGNPALVIAR